MKPETMTCDLCHAKWFRGDLHICPKCGLQFCITCRSQRQDDSSLRQPIKCLECGCTISSSDYLTEAEYRKLRENRARLGKNLNIVEKRKFCMHDGGQMPLTAKICPGCGMAPPSSADTRKCTNCGSVIPATAYFCSECGVPTTYNKL